MATVTTVRNTLTAKFSSIKENKVKYTNKTTGKPDSFIKYDIMVKVDPEEIARLTKFAKKSKVFGKDSQPFWTFESNGYVNQMGKFQLRFNKDYPQTKVVGYYQSLAKGEDITVDVDVTQFIYVDKNDGSNKIGWQLFAIPSAGKVEQDEVETDMEDEEEEEKEEVKPQPKKSARRKSTVMDDSE